MQSAEYATNRGQATRSSARQAIYRDGQQCQADAGAADDLKT
jgi:hypothetical protein